MFSFPSYAYAYVNSDMGYILFEKLTPEKQGME